MSHDYAQRRRVAVALAITTIAVPAAFLLNRDSEPEGGPTVTVIGSVTANSAIADEQSPSDGGSEPAGAATDAMGTTPVGFLDGTVPARDSDPATIAIPRLPESIKGTGTYRHDVSDVRRCIATGAPFNAELEITNLDNSRKVRCINDIRGDDEPADLVLNTDAFLQIADLTDAPIAVEISW